MRGLFFVAALLAAAPGPAMAGAGNFTIVNATGRDITALAIRRFGTTAWQPLGAAPKAGARGTVQFSDADCAFDIQGTLAGGVNAVWSGVNLCEAKSVTLNRSDSGAAWVDYD
ncbi:hypothetical protein [Sphingomonas sp.]|uniref:hypothetical protein n=1 Tax=Sphingomonas sp. TaxID=28214 RepID=UPI00286D666E|nr:hypothetical protein [Sphingomonas sp.]